jgi:hypothetical protein
MARASTWLEEGMLREPAACPERRVRPQLPSQLDPLETQLHLQLVCPKTTIEHHLWSSIMSASSWKHQHAQRYRVCKYASLGAQYHVLTKPTLKFPIIEGILPTLLIWNQPSLILGCQLIMWITFNFVGEGQACQADILVKFWPCAVVPKWENFSNSSEGPNSNPYPW